MQLNFDNQMPTDEVVLCDANGDCIEARGANGRILAGAVALALIFIGLSFVFKRLK